MILPEFQPIPFPAPLWLLKTLLVLGFFLHAIPMNIALWGGILSALYQWKGKEKNDMQAYALRLSKTISNALPLFISFAITQGIVPLLFLQLIYGPLYYSASIVMAVPWLLLLFILLFGYYGAYWFKYRSEKLGSFGPWLLCGVSVLFLIIGFLFTNNLLLMLTPEKWQPLMETHPNGLALNLDDPQLLPRLLHFVLAAVAVSGLYIGCIGWYWEKREAAYSQWLIRQGSGLFLIITLIQLGVGSWFLMVLPRETLLQFMGHERIGSIAFMGSMLLTVISLITTGFAFRSGRLKPFQIGLFSAVGVVLLMSVMRHMLREYATQGFFNPSQVPVQTQWDLLIAFIVLAVGLIIYLAWLVKLTWQSFHPQTLQTGDRHA